MFTNFASIDAQSFQQGNPGGVRRVLVMLSRKIKDQWPKKSVINDKNEVTALPAYTAIGTKWAEILFPDGTASVDWDWSGDAGFQSCKHTVELMLAGFAASIRTEMKKNINAGCVYIFQMKDEQYVVVGSSDDPIFAKSSFKGGKKGNDKRGYTLKGDVDGMMWEPCVIPEALMATLPIAPFDQEAVVV